MVLTTNEKNYISDKFGAGSGLKCCVASGLTWSVLDVFGATLNETGGTAQVVSRIASSVTQSLTINGIVYTNVSVASQMGRMLSLVDAMEVAANDGSPLGENQYCYVCQPPSCDFSMF